jgi:hypothetical protein
VTGVQRLVVPARGARPIARWKRWLRQKYKVVAILPYDEVDKRFIDLDLQHLRIMAAIWLGKEPAIGDVVAFGNPFDGFRIVKIVAIGVDLFPRPGCTGTYYAFDGFRWAKWPC